MTSIIRSMGFKTSSALWIDRSRSAFACVLATVGYAAFVVLSAECGYRLWLFFGVYGAQRGANHVSDGYFRLVYLAAGTGAAAALASLLLVRRRAWRWAAGVLVALNLILCLSFFVMHHTGALAHYSEFTALYGP